MTPPIVVTIIVVTDDQGVHKLFINGPFQHGTDMTLQMLDQARAAVVASAQAGPKAINVSQSFN